jgi:hypothetical protein
MNRAELQQLAEARLADAQVLLEAGRLDGAYYLLGYVVECALKSCIAKQFGLFLKFQTRNWSSISIPMT